MKLLLTLTTTTKVGGVWTQQLTFSCQSLAMDVGWGCGIFSEPLDFDVLSEMTFVKCV